MIFAKYLRGAGILIAQGAAQRVLGAVTSIVLARGLGTTGFGAYSAVITTATSAYGLVRFGVDAAIHVYAARTRLDVEASRLTGEVLGAGLGLLTALGLLAGICLAVGAEWLAVKIFGQADLSQLLRFAGLLTALQCLTQFSYAALVGFQQFAAYAKVMILNGLSVLTLTTIGMSLFGVAGALGGYGIGQTILAGSLGYATARAIKEHGIRLAFTASRRGVSSLLRLGVPFYLAGLVTVPVTFFLQGLLSRSAGVESLGLLRVIGTITSLIAFIPGSIAAATTSTLTRMGSESEKTGTKVFDYGFLHIKAVWYLTMMTAIVLAIITPTLITILFGYEYLDAIEPSTLALFSAALSATVAASGSLFFAVQRSSVIFWQAISQSLVIALVGVLTIPALGVLGYFGAELAGNLAGLIVVLAFAMRMSDSDRRDNRLVTAFLVGALAALGSVTAIHGMPNAWERTIALSLVALVATAAMFMFGLSTWERSTAARLMKEIFRLRADPRG